MNVEPEIHVDIPGDAAFVKGLILDKIDHLERVCDHISSCRVSVEEDQKHQRTGSPYRVRVVLTVPPRHELVARNESTEGDLHEEVTTVVTRVFDAAERQLKKLADKQRGRVKAHPEQEESVGVVKVVRAEEGFGFLETKTGGDVYFHENSLLNTALGDVDVGDVARYVPEVGEKGLQASTVHIVSRGEA